MTCCREVPANTCLQAPVDLEVGLKLYLIYERKSQI
jgi:hypothetical protein